MKKKKSVSQKEKYVSHSLLMVILLLAGIGIVIPLTLSVSKQQQHLSGIAATPQVCQGILIPAYFGPGSGMDKTIAASNVVRFLTANIGSGPGTSMDPGWAQAIAKAKSAGIRVMGYVATHTGSRPSAQVKAEVDAWKQLYGVTDIMFDETSEQAAAIPYYQDLTAYVHKTPGAVDKLNVGWIPPEGYMQAGDILGILEDSYSNFSNWTPPSWVHKYPSTHFMAELHHVPGTSVIPSIMNRFIQNNIGYVMLTDSTQPWGQFSSDTFWNAFIASVQANCTSAITSQIPLSTAPSPTLSFFCGGSTNGICATSTPTIPASIIPSQPPQVSNPPSLVPSLQISPTVPQNNSPTPSNTHKRFSGGVKQLLQLILQLIEKLLQLLEKYL